MLIIGAIITMQTKELEFRVANLDCEHDAAAIERGLQDFPGITDLKVYPKSAKVAIAYDPAATQPEIESKKLTSLGFPAQQGLTMAEPPKPWRNPKVITSVLSGVLLLVGWLVGLAGASEIVSTVLYIAAILIGGYYFGREALEELIFEREIGIEMLMAVAAVVATVLGMPAEGAMLVFLYSISEAAEGYTEQKTRSAIKALMNLAPKVALVRRDGGEREIPVEELEVGDVFIVKPGQSIATDGIILTGISSVNQAPVTGESVPVEKQPAEAVFAGSINGEGALEVRATKTFADNTIARIIHLVEEAQEKKGKSERFIERCGARYRRVVLLLGILIAVVPPLFLGADWATWIARATVFIVAAAPCALVISIPITLVASLGTGARNGVRIKGGVFIEELAKVKVVALDKTGTLTRGKPEVTDVVLFRQESDLPVKSQEELLALAAGIERRSAHPLAEAIVRYAEKGSIQPAELTGFKLHLVVNDCGELLAFYLTPGNVDDRQPVPHLAKSLFGKLFGDKGYISQPLADQLLEQDVQLITGLRKNMKNRLLALFDKLMLRKRALIETIIDQLKNISQIAHTRHRGVDNFLVNLVAGLIAYSHQPKKPSLNLGDESLALLPATLI